MTVLAYCMRTDARTPPLRNLWVLPLALVAGCSGTPSADAPLSAAERRAQAEAELRALFAWSEDVAGDPQADRAVEAVDPQRIVYRTAAGEPAELRWADAQKK